MNKKITAAKKRITSMKKRMSVLLTIALAAIFTVGCANAVKDGTAALREEKYEEALTAFEEAAESEDKDSSAQGYLGLGMTYYETEEYEKAFEAFQSAMDKGAAQTVESYNLMGICAMRTGDGEAALEYIQAGLALAESDKNKDSVSEELLKEMKYNEIICYEQQGEWEKAKEKADEYLSEYPDDENVKKEAEFLGTRQDT